MFIRGGNGFQISASPIPSLYRFIGKSQGQFEKFASLTSILYLKLSHTVEEILQFDLKLLNSEQVEVKFKGCRHKRATNVPPYIFEINREIHYPHKNTHLKSCQLEKPIQNR